MVGRQDPIFLKHIGRMADLIAPRPIAIAVLMSRCGGSGRPRAVTAIERTTLGLPSPQQAAA